MALEITFIKGESSRYRSRIVRSDGVTLEFEGGSYNKIGGRPGVVPHDLAHLIVEDEMGLAGGVWGVIDAGGLFRHTTVVAGRQRPHAASRGRAIVAAHHNEIMHAEHQVRLVCDVIRGTAPRDALDRATVERCARRLRASAGEWAALVPGAGLAAAWS